MKAINNALGFLLVLLIPWTVFSFIFWTPWPSEWSWYARGFYTILCLVLSTLATWASDEK